MFTLYLLNVIISHFCGAIFYSSFACFGYAVQLCMKQQMCLCCPKGIYVTRITPGGPADAAGLMMGDKIMQVCSEMDLCPKSTRWHYAYTTVSGASDECSHSPAVNLHGPDLSLRKLLQLFSKKILFLPAR